MEEGKYIYCIINEGKKKEFGLPGIGERGDEVYTCCNGELAAVVSNSPVKKFPINRKNTVTHQKVMEQLMKNYTVLPVRFSTIAEAKDGVSPEERIRERVLRERGEEFRELFAYMADKVELGIKALWTDMKAVYAEIVEENSEIKLLRQKLMGKPAHKTHSGRAGLGEMVMNALNAKHERLASKIMQALKKYSADSKKTKLFGDNMIMNGAFLVQEDQVPNFDKCIEILDKKIGEKGIGIRFKYVGPVPPCNFVEIVINWGEPRKED